MFQYVLKLADVAGRVAFVPPTDPGARENIKRELGKCRDKNNGYVLVTLQPPKRPRTTAKANHFHGHLSPNSRERITTSRNMRMCPKPGDEKGRRPRNYRQLDYARRRIYMGPRTYRRADRPQGATHREFIDGNARTTSQNRLIRDVNTDCILRVRDARKR